MVEAEHTALAGPLSEAFLVGVADAGTPRPRGGALEPAQSRAEADAIDVAFRRNAEAEEMEEMRRIVLGSRVSPIFLKGHTRTIKIT